MKIIKGIGKIVLAGIVATAILSGLMCFYDLLPVREPNPKGNTDYVWPANAPWVKLTEGISWGRFDAAGYNNAQVVENPDIIILGSSHMEATNVFTNQTVGARLGEMLDGRYSVYNMGIAAHDFIKICQYLPINLQLYEKTPKIVVLETMKVTVTEKDARQAMDPNVKGQESFATGIMGMLQKVPFFRCVYHQTQYGLLDIFMNNRGTAAARAEDGDLAVEEDAAAETVDEQPYDQLFQYLGELEKEYGTQIVIFCHPRETLDETEGVVYRPTAALRAFAKYAEKYGIDFIDMTGAFEEMYRADRLLPHGFVTGEAGEGHLNADGHRAVAEELYRLVEKLEKEGAICK